MDPKFEQRLQAVGLNEKESKVYLAALQLGVASIARITRKCGLKRPTVYVIIEGLTHKGYVIQVPREGIQMYMAVSPEDVAQNLHEKLRKFEAVLPELTAIAKITDREVHASYFEGKEQVKESYFDQLNYDNSEIVGWMSDASFVEHDASFWYENFQKERLKKKIIVRSIVTHNTHTDTYATDDAKTRKQVRFDISPYLGSFGADIRLYGGDKTLILSFLENASVYIQSKKVHDLLKGIFEVHWNSLKN